MVARASSRTWTAKSTCACCRRQKGRGAAPQIDAPAPWGGSGACSARPGAALVDPRRTGPTNWQPSRLERVCPLAKSLSRYMIHADGTYAFLGSDVLTTPMLLLLLSECGREGGSHPGTASSAACDLRVRNVLSRRVCQHDHCSRPARGARYAAWHARRSHADPRDQLSRVHNSS